MVNSSAFAVTHKKKQKKIIKEGKLTFCVVQKSASIVSSGEIAFKALSLVLVRVAWRSSMFEALSAVAAASLSVFLVTAAFIFEIPLFTAVVKAEFFVSLSVFASVFAVSKPANAVAALPIFKISSRKFSVFGIFCCYQCFVGCQMGCLSRCICWFERTLSCSVSSCCGLIAGRLTRFRCGFLIPNTADEILVGTRWTRR